MGSWKKLTSEIFFSPQTLVISWLAMVGYASLRCIPQVPCRGWLLDGLYQLTWSGFLFLENATSISSEMSISQVLKKLKQGISTDAKCSCVFMAWLFLQG